MGGERYCNFQMKIEDKLELSWAKLSHPNSIELRLTAVSRISCSLKSQTELVCYKNVYSTSVEQEGMVEKNHIVDFSYKNSFYQSS